jgi:hypothetical protein
MEAPRCVRGRTLPEETYRTPNVLNFLVGQIHIRLVSNPQADLAAALA